MAPEAVECLRGLQRQQETDLRLKEAILRTTSRRRRRCRDSTTTDTTHRMPTPLTMYTIRITTSQERAYQVTTRHTIHMRTKAAFQACQTLMPSLFKASEILSSSRCDKRPISRSREPTKLTSWAMLAPW